MREQNKLRRLTVTGLLAAMALALSFLEGLLPPLPIPGARFGLANVAVMYALTGLSLPCAAGITAVKALFALLRGGTACLMSAAGGGAALLVMTLALRLLRERISPLGLGILGAVAHNAGQWAMAFVLLGPAMWYYAPVLLVLAIPAGCITGLTLHVTTPYLDRLTRRL